MTKSSSKKDTVTTTATVRVIESATIHIKTPPKQTPLETPSVPMKKYNTRNRINGGVKNIDSDIIQTSEESTSESTYTQRNLAQDFDAAFFDDSSSAWNQNKRKLGNGMYSYHTRTVTSNKKK